jgi:hypothetical protein
MKKSIFTIILITIFALTTKAQSVRDCFLVDSVFNLATGGVSKYFYDENNKLTEKITKDRDNTQHIYKPEYENGLLRKAKVLFLYENDTNYYYDYYNEYFYNEDRQLIRFEYKAHEFAPVFSSVDYFYIEGTNYIDSLYADDDNWGPDPNRGGTRCKYFYDDEMKNVVRVKVYHPYPSYRPTGYAIENRYYEYDDHPTPNVGVDEPLPYILFAPFATTVASNNKLSSTRYVPDEYDTTFIHIITDNNWSFTYNEYGLLETVTFNNRPTPTLVIKYKKICDIITTTTELVDQILIYPNPAKEIINFNYETEVEIYDLLGKTLLKTEKPVKYVNISSLNSGLYFIKLNNNRIEKFIKE